MKKLSYNHIKQHIEEFGYQLVSKEYRNNYTKIEIVCPKNHYFEMSYSNFQAGQRCPICFGNKKLSYNHIKQHIEEFGYQLVSKEYRNVHTKLEFICPKGHFFEMTYGNFQQGHRCPICFGTPKLSYNHVKKYIEGFGYQLVSKEYINNHTKLKMVCPKGHNFEIIYDCFQRGIRCSVCAGNKKYSYNYVKKYIEGFGYQLVSKKYRNNNTKLKIVCPEGHLFEMIYSNFKREHRCPECAKHLVTSKGEKEVLNFVQSIYQGKIIENDRTQIINPLTGKYLELDIWLPELNRAIEYNGGWWHKDRKEIDDLKQMLCSEKRIELMVIDEKKWLKNKNFEVINNFVMEIF